MKGRSRPRIPETREFIAACLFLTCAAAWGQSVVDSIRFPCPAELPGGYHCLAYDYNDRLLYVAGDGCESLFVIDDRHGAMVGAVRLDGHVTSVCYNPLVNRVYCGTDSAGYVHVVEPVTNRRIIDFRFEDGIFALVLDTAANRLFCVGGSGTVHVINCATNTVQSSVRLPVSLGVGVATCYVPPFRRAYVAAEPESLLYVLDCAGESLLAAIPLAHGPSALCYNPANGELYAASRSDTTLEVIDPVANKVIASMPGAPDGTRWLCSNATSNKVYAMGRSTLSVFEGRSDSLRTRIEIGAACGPIAWDSRHNAVYTTCTEF